jgi:hypothetical protein
MSAISLWLLAISSLSPSVATPIEAMGVCLVNRPTMILLVLVDDKNLNQTVAESQAIAEA